MSFYDPGADDAIDIDKMLQKCKYCGDKTSTEYDNGHGQHVSCVEECNGRENSGKCTACGENGAARGMRKCGECDGKWQNYESPE